MAETEDGEGGAGDEDAGLVDEAVGWIEGTVGVEGGGGGFYVEEEGGSYTLIDGILGDVDEEEWKHAIGKV